MSLLPIRIIAFLSLAFYRPVDTLHILKEICTREFSHPYISPETSSSTNVSQIISGFCVFVVISMLSASLTGGYLVDAEAYK